MSSSDPQDSRPRLIPLMSTSSMTRVLTFYDKHTTYKKHGFFHHFITRLVFRRGLFGAWGWHAAKAMPEGYIAESRHDRRTQAAKLRRVAKQLKRPSRSFDSFLRRLFAQNTATA